MRRLDLWSALGSGGQATFVWPDKDVVAVFTGRGVDVLAEVAPRVAAALQSDAALDPNPEAYARLNAAIEDATEPPAAMPTPPLPQPKADEISGEVYRLEPNSFDVQCISLRFDSPSEVWFDLTLDSGAFTFPVGMDGVPRFLETGPTGTPVGVLGEWTEPSLSLFSMDYDEVGGSIHLRIVEDFADSPENVQLDFSDLRGSLPTQTIPASSVATCN